MSGTSSCCTCNLRTAAHAYAMLQHAKAPTSCWNVHMHPYAADLEQSPYKHGTPHLKCGQPEIPSSSQQWSVQLLPSSLCGPLACQPCASGRPPLQSLQTSGRPWPAAARSGMWCTCLSDSGACLAGHSGCCQGLTAPEGQGRPVDRIRAQCDSPAHASVTVLAKHTTC